MVRTKFLHNSGWGDLTLLARGNSFRLRLWLGSSELGIKKRKTHSMLRFWAEDQPMLWADPFPDGAAMNESEKQFSFTRAAPSTSGRAKNQIPISWAGFKAAARN